MKTHCRLFITLILSSPQVLLAGGAIHKYWVCGVTTYQSIVNGKTQSGQCRANTAYSEPPCREFVVEFDGANGIQPGAPYRQNANGATTNIEINQANGQHSYLHTINKHGEIRTYHGKCNYFEAPANAKIHMEYGLKTQP
ncbi:hypothetical protein MCAMS1_01087 [biofilm metagenome]